MGVGGVKYRAASFYDLMTRDMPVPFVSRKPHKGGFDFLTLTIGTSWTQIGNADGLSQSMVSAS